MTSTTNHQTGLDGSPDTGQDGVAGTARAEAGHVAESVGEAAREVAGTAKEKAVDVTSDVRDQTAKLIGETRDQLVGQAGQQKDRAAEGLRSVADELREMAEHGQSGWGAQLAGHGAQFGDQAADFLQQHEPAELLDEVRRYARKRPGAFLLGAAVLGVVAGRMTRALAGGAPSSSGQRMTPAPTAYPVTDDYLVPPPDAPVPGSPFAGSSALDGPTSAPPVPAPVVPDVDPGTPVTPRFEPGAGR
jgi:hypothetical protein